VIPTLAEVEMTNPRALPSIPRANAAERITVIRGQKAILDSDLAALYGVSTKRLNEQVRRNPERFPPDFMFALSSQEWESLRSQFATLKTGRGQHRKFLPCVFTEHGALMAANVLNSTRAIEMSIFLVRTFVELRQAAGSHQELSKRLDQLEDRIERKLARHDHAIAEILSAIRSLMKPPGGSGRPIGFVTPREK